jgi:putative AlgH/UPF0301 family transcriptional regulator
LAIISSPSTFPVCLFFYSAKTFDDRPPTKALITRGLGPQLPEPLDTAVAAFLGGKGKSFYWPAPLAPQSVVEAVKISFRHPTIPEPTIDGGFQGLRYLNALLNIARNSGMLEQSPLKAFSATATTTTTTTPSALENAVEEISQLQHGAILIAHPCLPHWFSRTVVLICDHSSTKTLGLCLNKPYGGDVIDLVSQGRKAGAGNLGLDLTSSSLSISTAAGVEGESGVQMKMTVGGGRKKNNNTSTASSINRINSLERGSFPFKNAIVLNELTEDSSSGADDDGFASEDDDGSSSSSEIEFVEEEEFSSDFSDDDDVERTRSLLDELEEEDQEDDEEEEQRRRLFEAISLLSGSSAGSDDSLPTSGLEGLFNIDSSEDGVELVFETDDEETMNLIAAAAAALTEELENRRGSPSGDGSSGGAGTTLGDLADISKEAATAVDKLPDGPQKEALMAMLDALGSTHRRLVAQVRDKEESGEDLTSSILTAAIPPPSPPPSEEGASALHTTTTTGSDGDGGSGSGDDNNNSTTADTNPESPIDPSAQNPLLSQHQQSPATITAKELMAMSPRSQIYLGGPLPGVHILHTRVGTLGGKAILGDTTTTSTDSDKVVMFGTDVTLPQAAAALAPLIEQHQSLDEDASDTDNSINNKNEEKSRVVSADQLRFYLGSSQWAPNQLQQELLRGSWIKLEGSLAADIFKTLSGGESDEKINPSAMQAEAWQRVLSMVSPEHAALAAVPESAWEELQMLEI